MNTLLKSTVLAFCLSQTMAWWEDCTYIDFTRDGGGPLKKYEYIKKLNVGPPIDYRFSTPGNACGHPRIFQTNNPPSGYEALGSPNEACSPAGPGKGEAGAPGQPGENCVDPKEWPLGNVLVVQDDSKCDKKPAVPDPNGGTILVEFSKIINVGEIRVLNVGK